MEGRALPNDAFQEKKEEREATLDERKRIRALPPGSAQTEYDALASEIRRYSPAQRQEVVRPTSKRRQSFQL